MVMVMIERGGSKHDIKELFWSGQCEHDSGSAGGHDGVLSMIVLVSTVPIPCFVSTAIAIHIHIHIAIAIHIAMHMVLNLMMKEDPSQLCQGRSRCRFMDHVMYSPILI